MAKPPIKQVPSDDCVVTFDGEEYRPHEGEWIKVVPGLSVAEIHLLRELNELKPRLEAVEGDEDEQEQSIALMDKSFERATSVLSGRIVEWNWTDHAGQRYPKRPDREAIASLHVQEVYYLLGAVRGETPGEQGNGSRPSPTTSSASRRQRRRV